VAVDFCEMALGICRYDGLDQVLDERLIDRVAKVYFVHGDDSLAPAIDPGPDTTLDPVSDPAPNPNPAPNRTVDQAPYGHDDAQRQATTSDEAPASPAPSAEPVPPGSTRPVATPRPEHRVAQPLQSRPIANPGR
jgi:hypothetical protein